MICGAPRAPRAVPVGLEGEVPSTFGRGRAEGQAAPLLALPLLLRLHALRVNEVVDVLDDDALQHAEGIVAAVADHNAVLASFGASILPQFKLAFTAFPCLKVTFGWICSLIWYFSVSPSSSQRTSCLSNWASNSGRVMLLTSAARSNLRSVMQRAYPHGQVTLPRCSILTRISLRQVFCTLQVTSPVSGFWLCNVEHRATAHAAGSRAPSSPPRSRARWRPRIWAPGPATGRARSPGSSAQAVSRTQRFWACLPVSLVRRCSVRGQRTHRRCNPRLDHRFVTHQATGNMTRAQRLDQTRPNPDASSRHSTMRSNIWS